MVVDIWTDKEASSRRWIARMWCLICSYEQSAATSTWELGASPMSSNVQPFQSINVWPSLSIHKELIDDSHPDEECTLNNSGFSSYYEIQESQSRFPANQPCESEYILPPTPCPDAACPCGLGPRRNPSGARCRHSSNRWWERPRGTRTVLSGIFPEPTKLRTHYRAQVYPRIRVTCYGQPISRRYKPPVNGSGEWQSRCAFLGKRELLTATNSITVSSVEYLSIWN